MLEKKQYKIFLALWIPACSKLQEAVPRVSSNHAWMVGAISLSLRLEDKDRETHTCARVHSMPWLDQPVAETAAQQTACMSAGGRE